MEILNREVRLDTEEEFVILVFKDDDEFNSLMARLANTPVKTSGIRIVPLLPANMELTSFQQAILDIINGLDGIGSNDIEADEKIIAESVDKLKNILNHYK